ncbi:MAG: phosphotransferase family protein [Acidimicrobiales bacterium]
MSPDSLDADERSDRLSGAQRSAVEGIVGSTIVEMTIVWERAHVVRAGLASGGSVIVKRPRDQSERELRQFATEVANLTYLSAMPDPIAPRLLGSDPNRQVVVMEDLPAGRSLADSLLGGNRVQAEADVVAFAATLGRLHRWSFDHPPTEPQPLVWADHAEGRVVGALRTAAANAGVVVGDGLEAECAMIVARLREAGAWQGFVHGDACPDNTRIIDDRFVLFDFERSGWGSVLLDASYVVAPFPSCWCFAPLPADLSSSAIQAYRDAVGPRPGFDDGLAAALFAWVIARGEILERNRAGSRVTVEGASSDREWGTTTIRPRLLSWLRVAANAPGYGYPVLRTLSRDLADALAEQWSDPERLAYPALAKPGETSVSAPAWWTPGG